MSTIRKTIIALITIALAAGLAAAPASAHHDGDYPPLAFRIDVVGEIPGSISQNWLFEESEGVNRFDPADMGHSWELEVESNAHTRSVQVVVRGVYQPIENLSGRAFTFDIADSSGFIHGGTYEITTQGFSGLNGTGEAGPVKTFIIEIAYPVLIVDGLDLSDFEPVVPVPAPQTPPWWTWTWIF